MLANDNATRVFVCLMMDKGTNQVRQGASCIVSCGWGGWPKFAGGRRSWDFSPPLWLQTCDLVRAVDRTLRTNELRTFHEVRSCAAVSTRFAVEMSTVTRGQQHIDHSFLSNS